MHTLGIKPDEPGFDLALGIVIGSILLFIGALFWLSRIIARWEQDRKNERRGFEVKPITGEQTRAETKKDDHHG